MNSLHGETILRESKGRNLILSTHRIRYQSENFGSAQVKSIMLEELASCALVRTSQPIFLVLAGVCFFIGFLMASRNGEGVLLVSLVIAGVFVLFYFLSQQQVLAFASAGATIRVNTKGMKLEDAKEFIDHAEAAKNSRYFARG